MSAARSSNELQDISDTALWVAAYRAEESERRDAVFRDPFARRLAGERGFEVLGAMPKGRQLAWPMVTRTHVFDRYVTECVAGGADLVLNLAAGLDARPYRMALPPSLTWIEVDLPRMIEYKSAVLAEEQPVCKLERVALDLADREARRDLLRAVGRAGRRGLVLTEGLLIYLERPQVEALAADLAAVPVLGWWALDLASPALLKRMQPIWGKEVDRAGAPFRFAPEEGPGFFATHGWPPRQVRSAFHTAGRIKRLPWYLRPFTLLPEPRKFNARSVWSGFCLCGRAGEAG